MTDPQKTSGVKDSLALVSKLVVQKNNQIRITKTNISEFL